MTLQQFFPWDSIFSDNDAHRDFDNTLEIINAGVFPDMRLL